MKIINVIVSISFLAVLFSCAPVKFSKSDRQILRTDCLGESCNTSLESIKCNPLINSAVTTVTISASSQNFLSITSACSPADVEYTWTVKKADGSFFAADIPGLLGANPNKVNFSAFGKGVYYLYLQALKPDSSLGGYYSATPLEFVVQGPGLGSSLTCDPKLNGNLSSVIINSNDVNPNVTANCIPSAGSYIWTATKDGSSYVVSGLSGSQSNPDFKSMGEGVYKLSLYATSLGSTHWQSSNPLTITVNSKPSPTLENSFHCNPKINGSQSNLTLINSSPNPLISANCLPRNIQYNWSVFKNGNKIAIGDLLGAHSNPNFHNLGKGTYLISLKVSQGGLTLWNTTNPLVITVDDEEARQTLNCSPRLNNTATAISIALNGNNPTVTAGCQPTSAAYSWKVFKNEKNIDNLGLMGASSKGQFIQAGAGLYKIYLTASMPGYNSYVSPISLDVLVGESEIAVRNVITEYQVATRDKKVDLLLVMDDSKSMLSENMKLSKKLEGFVKSLTDAVVDWQMCATVARAQDDNSEKIAYWGVVRKWINYIGSPQWLLTAGAINQAPIFADTISAMIADGGNSDDERGVKAAWHSIDDSEFNKCFRPQAALAMILISDEDERSVGGNESQIRNDTELKRLENDDYAESLVNKVKQNFGERKRFTFNSIIVKPGDEACLKLQDLSDSKSHYGYQYSALSQITDGAIVSIGDADYASGLSTIRNKILNSLARAVLECTPVGQVYITVTPAIGDFNASFFNNNVVFNPPIPDGRTVKLEYKCPLM